MNVVIGLFIKFKDLYWWQMILCGAYFIYFLIRSHDFWVSTDNSGILKGYKYVIFGYGKVFRVYHIVRILFDIPPAIIGLLFPVLKSILRFKIYEFKPEKPPEYNYIVTVQNELIRDSQIVDTSTEEFKKFWTVPCTVNDMEKLRWCDFDNHDVVLGIVTAEK